MKLEILSPCGNQRISQLSYDFSEILFKTVHSTDKNHDLNETWRLNNYQQRKAINT